MFRKVTNAHASYLLHPIPTSARNADKTCILKENSAFYVASHTQSAPVYSIWPSGFHKLPVS